MPQATAAGEGGRVLPVFYWRLHIHRLAFMSLARRFAFGFVLLWLIWWSCYQRSEVEAA